MFCKKGVLRKFTKFAEKHLCQSLFFNKVEKDSGTGVFLRIFAKFLRTPFLTEHPGGCFWSLILVEDVRQGSKYATWKSIAALICLNTKILEEVIVFCLNLFCSLSWVVNIKMAFTERLFYNLTTLRLDKVPSNISWNDELRVAIYELRIMSSYFKKINLRVASYFLRPVVLKE